MDTLKIAHEVDVIWCTSRSAAFSKKAGFEGKELWEIAIAVRELTTNVLKFAGSGTLELRLVGQPRKGIEVTVEDEGPGIEDIEAAMADGCSEGEFFTKDAPITNRSSLGTGLGAVKRLMDNVEIENNPEGGTRVVAYKWLP